MAGRRRQTTSSLATLAGKARSPEPSERRAAAQALAPYLRGPQQPDAMTAFTLLGLLAHDPDPTTATSARQSLGREPELVAPVYLLSLTIENLRCFGSPQTLDLSDGHQRPAQWTVILGDNGTGKTTLLRCLTTLEDRLWPFIRPHTANQAAPARIAAELAFGSPLQSQQPGQRWQGDRLVVWEGEQRSTLRLGSLTGFTCYGYGAARRLQGSRLSADPADLASATLFLDDAGLADPEEWLLQTHYAANFPGSEATQQAAAQHRFSLVRELLIGLLPDIEDIRISGPTARRDRPAAELKTPYGWVQTGELGLGYRTMIAWLVDLARRLVERYPTSPDPLAEPAVVLIDEIDLHLHPHWQRTIMSYLGQRLPNTQFIVTAHSPLVVQAAADANLVLLRRQDDRVEIVNDPPSIKGYRVDQVLTSDLFGLPSARPPATEALLERRTAILASGRRLTARDRAELRRLERHLGPLPNEETPADIQAAEIIRRAAALLQPPGGDD